jgi:hypothetical protein
MKKELSCKYITPIPNHPEDIDQLNLFFITT